MFEANRRTGRNCLYFANLCAARKPFGRNGRNHFGGRRPRGTWLPRWSSALRMRHLAEKYPLAVMAHPSLSGTFFHDRNHGMLPAVLLGTIFRLAGADISVFPNAGGRFSLTPPECAGIGEHLRRPLGSLRSSWPAPAGGMKYENIPAIARHTVKMLYFFVGAPCCPTASSWRTRRAISWMAWRPHFSENSLHPNFLNSSCELPLECNLPAAFWSACTDQFKWAGAPFCPTNLRMTGRRKMWLVKN